MLRGGGHVKVLKGSQMGDKLEELEGFEVRRQVMCWKALP